MLVRATHGRVGDGYFKPRTSDLDRSLREAQSFPKYEATNTVIREVRRLEARNHSDSKGLVTGRRHSLPFSGHKCHETYTKKPEPPNTAPKPSGEEIRQARRRNKSGSYFPEQSYERQVPYSEPPNTAPQLSVKAERQARKKVCTGPQPYERKKLNSERPEPVQSSSVVKNNHEEKKQTPYSDQDFELSKKEFDYELLEDIEEIPESKLHQESHGTSQQLNKEDKVTKWQTVTTVEDAMSVINEEKLHDKHTLNNLVKRLGRKSATVSFVCESIVTEIEQTTPDISHVFAAYTTENQNNVHFVGYFEDVSNKYDSNKDYDIVWRNNKDKESEQLRELMHLSTEESLALRETVNAVSKQYMEKYKYLSAITARKIKTEEGEKLCIIMYVHPCTGRYSSIPISEEPFPNEINGYKVVVRNGIFKPATNTAGDYHTDLRMGCKITSDLVNSQGTLGGFINHPIYGLCGFTCAHVVYGKNKLQDLKKAKRFRNAISNAPCLVYQPSKDFPHIGRVVEAVYTAGDSDSAGVDLALFQIENRPPRSGTFPSSNEEFEYVTGETWGRTRFSCGACEITKFGVTTGITNGKLLFDGMSVNSLTFVTKADLKGIDSVLYNQYEIMNDSSNVCELGDSGGLVFMKDCTNELVCIGMVNGVLDKENQPNHGVVTPITDILLELKVQTLKTFRKEVTEDLLKKELTTIRNEMVSLQRQTISEISKLIANPQPRTIPSASNVPDLQHNDTEDMDDN